MKIKFKKILKLFIGLMSPLLLGLSVVPIITSCSKSEEGLIPPGDGTIGELDASEEFIKNVNGVSTNSFFYKKQFYQRIQYYSNIFTCWKICYGKLKHWFWFHNWWF